MSKRPIGVTALTLLLSSGAALAQGASTNALHSEAQIYELTENVSLMSKGHPRRTATSEMMGFIKSGTPVCPAGPQVQTVPVWGDVCTLNITASDNVSLTTGKGPLQGRFTIAVQEVVTFPNGTTAITPDSPERVVMRGNFRGKIDFFGTGIPGVGWAEGFFTSDDGQRFPFTGTFRVPLPGFGITNAWTLCHNPVLDPACFPVYTDIFGNGYEGVVPVQPHEYGLGFPTVRFDISFH